MKIFVDTIIKIFDKDGKEIRRDVYTDDPPVQNFLVILRNCLSRQPDGLPTTIIQLTLDKATDINGSQYTSLPDIFNVGNYFATDAPMCEQLQLANAPDTWGIVIGSDDSPYTVTQYKLFSPYPCGRGVGYFNYLDTDVIQPYFDGTYVIWGLHRLMINDSDSPQWVREVGIIAYDSGAGRLVLISRDIVSPPIQVPPRGVLDITILFRGIMSLYQAFIRLDWASPVETSTRGVV